MVLRRETLRHGGLYRTGQGLLARSWGRLEMHSGSAAGPDIDYGDVALMTDNVQLIAHLKALYALLEPPYAWCKGASLKPDKRAPDGYARCLNGASEAVVGKHHPWIRYALMGSLPATVWVSDFNDAPTTRKRDVLKLIQDTIDRVEKRHD
jgi:hypothetical protein